MVEATTGGGEGAGGGEEAVGVSLVEDPRGELTFVLRGLSCNFACAILDFPNAGEDPLLLTAGMDRGEAEAPVAAAPPGTIPGVRSAAAGVPARGRLIAAETLLFI
jgi:hypothetical protein